ncbi:MAG TPA: TMEM175 family protein [Microbacterium sp.]|nr:TMEM175 family protein [Microbacterium sp.]
MIRQRRHPAATLSTTRLEAFTDGVFAIAATLLVLDLTTHAIGEAGSDAELWAALTGMGGLFFNFFVSFVLLALLWTIHVRQFEFISRVDGAIIWLNNARLLFIVIVPFATTLTTDYSGFLIGRMAMPVTFFAAVMFSWLQWEWARRRRTVVMPDLSEQDARDMSRAGTSALVISVAVVVISPWAGSFGFVLFFLDPFLTRLFVGRRASGDPESA